MYRVSEQFITAIKNNARYIKCYFTLNGTEYNPITITIDNNIYSSDKDAFVGTFIGKSGSIKVRANDNLDLENKDIQLYFGIKLDDDTIEYVPQGTYRVYEKTSNTEYKICDHKIFFNEKINTKEVPYPTTVEKLATWVGKKLDIDVIIPTDFPNRNLTISSEIFFGYDATYANAVEAITQATCTFAQINRSGQLEFRWFKKVDFSIDIENLPKGYPVLSKVLDPINSIVLAREPQNDNVYWPETVEDTRSEFKISNNPILDIDRYTSRMDIYDRINGFSYTPVSVGTQGFFHLDTGDIVSLQVKDEMYVDMLIMNHTLKYSGGISSQFETPALSKTMINYSVASSIESQIFKTQLEVDKVGNRITAEITEVNTKIDNIPIPEALPFPPENAIEGQIWIDITMNPPTEKIFSNGEWVIVGDYTGDLENLLGQLESLNTSLSLEQGKIETLIKNNTTIINGNEVTLKQAYSYMKQEIDAIQFAISESGGNNKLLNSCGWNGLKYWNHEGDIVSLTNVEIRNSTISGYAFLLNKGHMEQSFKTIVGRKYSVSCKIKKFTNSCTLIVKNGTSEDVLFNLNEEYEEGWISFSMPVEALDTSCTVYIESSGEYLYISDIMVNDGEISQQWSSSNDEIYTMNVKIDREGIEISQDDTNNRTVINTNEFAGYEGTKQVFSVNGDVTEVNRLKANSDVQIGVVRAYAKTTGSKKGLGFAYIKGGSL